MIKPESSMDYRSATDITGIFDEMGNTDILDKCGVSYRKRSDLLTTNNQCGLLNYVRSPFFNDEQWEKMRTDTME